MALIVQKFGGTSLGSVELIERAAERVAASRSTGDDVVVVCSAMGHETDRLLDLARAITPKPEGRELDTLLSSGEQVSVALLAMALQKRGWKARSYLGDQVPIFTESVHGKARITQVVTDGLRADLTAGIVPVVAGYQGVDRQGNTTTLGRGGSDTSAVALAAALHADECQILSDVAGVYTTDPRLVPEAQLIRTLSFEEMLELASQGSQVLQIRAVEFARRHNVPLRVMQAGDATDPGTRVSEEQPTLAGPAVAGIAFNRDEAQITIPKLPNRPDIMRQIFVPVAGAHIEVDVIVVNIAQRGHIDLSFTVHRSDFEQACERVRAAVADIPECEVRGNDHVVKISLVGIGMRSQVGVASRMFDALAEEGILVRVVTTSEIKISVLIDEQHLETGVKCLHRAFGLDGEPAGASQQVSR